MLSDIVHPGVQKQRHFKSGNLSFRKKDKIETIPAPRLWPVKRSWYPETRDSSSVRSLSSILCLIKKGVEKDTIVVTQ
jgi:hypothetical protein